MIYTVLWDDIYNIYSIFRWHSYENIRTYLGKIEKFRFLYAGYYCTQIGSQRRQILRRFSCLLQSRKAWGCCEMCGENLGSWKSQGVLFSGCHKVSWLKYKFTSLRTFRSSLNLGKKYYSHENRARSKVIIRGKSFQKPRKLKTKYVLAEYSNARAFLSLFVT